jgi:hypothetical protein
LWRPSGFVCDVPITSGSVSFSLSRADGDRSGSITVPGYSWEDLLSPKHYGWIVVTIDIDDARWNLGEFPITGTQVETPGGAVVVTLGDWAYRRSRSVVEEPANSLIVGTTVADMAAQHMSHVMPWTVTCTRDDTGGAMMPTEAKLGGGADVWAAMQQAAGLSDARLVMTSRSTLELRRYDPAEAASEDLAGLLIRGTRTVSAAKGDACNRVVVRMDGADGQTFGAVRTLDTGPFAYGQEFGFAQIVENVRVESPSDDAAEAESMRIGNRRFGAMKSVDVQTPVLPWLEVGDTVSVDIGGVLERVLIETLTVPLTANQPMRLTGRDGGWTGVR